MPRGREGQRQRSVMGRLIGPLWRVIGRVWSWSPRWVVPWGPVSRMMDETGEPEPEVSPYGSRLPHAELTNDERREAAEELSDQLRDQP